MPSLFRLDPQIRKIVQITQKNRSSVKVTCVVRPARGVLSPLEGDFCAIAKNPLNLRNLRIINEPLTRGVNRLTMRDVTYEFLISDLHIYDIDFAYTVTLRFRIDPQNVAGDGTKLLKALRQIGEDEQLAKYQAAIRGGSVQCIAEFQQACPLIPISTLYDKLFLLLPGQPGCDYIQTFIMLELPERLKKYDVAMDCLHTITIERLHLATHLVEALARDERTLPKLHQQFPTIPEELLLQTAGVVAARHDRPKWQVFSCAHRALQRSRDYASFQNRVTPPLQLTAI